MRSAERQSEFRTLFGRRHIGDRAVAITPDILVVFTVILTALAFFATEPVPVDVTAIGVMMSLMLIQSTPKALASAGILGTPTILLESYPGGAPSGLVNTATLTVLAMFILGEGVQQTGIIQLLGAKISTFASDSELRQLGTTVGVVDPISGFINNTAAIAVLLPIVTDLAERGRASPSKFLLPPSHTSMFGDVLTFIGTSTNILASDVYSYIMGGAPFSMFEFTVLGVVMIAVGVIYFITIGHRLTPGRIEPRRDLTEEFEMAGYLTEVVIRKDSPLVSQQVQQALAETEFGVDLLQLIHGESVFLEPLGPKGIQPGDVFTLQTNRGTLIELPDVEGLDLVPATVAEDELELADHGQNLVEVVVVPGPALVGKLLASASFRRRYDATMLALRHGGEFIRRRTNNLPLRIGGTLLVQATVESIERLNNSRNFIVAQEIERRDYRESKVPVAVGIVAGVVALAALDFLPIVTAALLGALAMVATKRLRPAELYDAVQWDVIFLLAGVIPLGITMENSKTANLLVELVVMTGDYLPFIAVLGMFYFMTAFLTNVISSNVSVVLMVPVAIEAMAILGADPFSFALAVMFAASTAFTASVGYQTNLFVYSPGGCKFTDYIRVGGPLQLLLGVMTTIGVVHFFPLT